MPSDPVTTPATDDYRDLPVQHKGRKAEYRRECERLLRDHPGCLSEKDLQGFLPEWLASLDRDALRDARPWITFPAARALENLLTPDSRVLEYGAGGSTLFFAKRVRTLVTIEHDREWLQRTVAHFDVVGQPALLWQAHWVEPTKRKMPVGLSPTDPEAYASTDGRFADMSLEDYVKTIERYRDNYFDIVLIGGRARPSCFKHAVAKVKLGGYIVVDNSEREAYGWIREAAEKLCFEVQDYWGPGPYNRYFWCTSILRKVRARFALNDLDGMLERYLDFQGGTFVEAGANDGVSQSNTFYLESQRGWRGLLIEPIYERMLECMRYRPHARVAHAALVPPEGVGMPAVLRYANLMSVLKGSMRSPEEEDAHIQAGCEVQKIQTHEFSAPTKTLSSLLDEFGLTHVDLLSLDIEGYEAKALRGLDLSRHQPRYILVEARYRDEVHAVLAGRYELVAELSQHDLLYRLKGDAGPKVVKPEADSAPEAAVPTCIVCESAMTAQRFGMFDDRYGYPGLFTLFRCPRCGQLQTDPLVEETDLPALYATYYPRRQVDVQALVRQVGEPWSMKERLRRWLCGTDNQGQYAARPGMVVLDYGCGSGQSLLELEKLGARAYGIEADPNVKRVADALNLRIHVGTLDDDPFPGVHFDLIVLNQVLEHIPRPARVLSNLAARLRPGGQIVLSFPNAASGFCRWFGRDWINWHVPYHLHHFNPRSAREFFSRHGFRVTSLRTITPNLWTVLQLRALRERTRIGVPSSLWTGQGTTVEPEVGYGWRTRLIMVLHRIALRANERWARLGLTVFNRICDVLGKGDSILVTIKRREDA